MTRPAPVVTVAWIAVAVVVGVRFAEPILDGDLFFHLAYARQMIERGTLVLDHTTFSWTPASNAMIYCAWIAQLWFYALWEHIGPWSLFAFRYLVLAVVLLLAASYAWRAGVRGSVLLPAVLLLLALSSHAGTIVKPELFSLLFFHVVVWVYFSVKRAEDGSGTKALKIGTKALKGLRSIGDTPPSWSEGALAPSSHASAPSSLASVPASPTPASPSGRPPSSRLFYLVPAVVFVWVNTHGGFVLVAPLLIAVWIGEMLNARLSPGLALSPLARRHMTIAWLLSAAAVVATPYGLRYPVQLVQDLVLGATARPDAVWNTAHRTAYDPAALALHLAEFGILLLVLVGAAFWLAARDRPVGARVDLAVLLANAVGLVLFLSLLRTTYYWPAIATYSTWHLLARSRVDRSLPLRQWLTQHPAGQMLVGVAAGVMLFVGGRAVYEARYRPLDRSWLGFGIGEINPVAEAEFLARAQLGPRLINIFDSGGYLLWRLAPDYKVMTDQRSFPYLDWFDDQYRFTTGDIFDTFLTKYPGDVAIIDLKKARTVDNFLASADWQWVYYGATAVVFVRAGTVVPPEALAVAPDRFDRIRSPSSRQHVAEFARRVGDDRSRRP